MKHLSDLEKCKKEVLDAILNVTAFYQYISSAEDYLKELKEMETFTLKQPIPKPPYKEVEMLCDKVIGEVDGAKEVLKELSTYINFDSVNKYLNKVIEQVKMNNYPEAQEAIKSAQREFRHRVFEATWL